MRGSEQRVSKRGECGAAGLDPAAIAQRVRQIAHDIREVLRKTHSSPRELIDLVERIDELRASTRGTQMLAIDRWLDNSCNALRARVAAEQTPLNNVYASVCRRRDCMTAC